MSTDSSSLDQRLMDDLKNAMRGGEAVRKDTIRMLRSALHNARIEQGRALTSAEEIAILARQMKQRRESIEEFRRGGREDLASKEEQELAILQVYQPAQLPPEEIDAHIRAAIAATGASSPREQGKVMAWLAPRLRGQADLSEVSRVVQRRLTEQGS